MFMYLKWQNFGDSNGVCIQKLYYWYVGLYSAK